MRKSPMKHTIPILLTASVILFLLPGCGAAGKQSTVVTVRIANQSAVNLYGIAASYSVNGETLGSKVCERIDKKAGQAVYEFVFAQEELPEASIDSLQLDVFAAKKAGEDYSNCGSAVIKSPQPGATYTLAINGEEVAALTLSTTERDVEISGNGG